MRIEDRELRDRESRVDANAGFDWHGAWWRPVRSTPLRRSGMFIERAAYDVPQSLGRYPTPSGVVCRGLARMH